MANENYVGDLAKKGIFNLFDEFIKIMKLM